MQLSAVPLDEKCCRIYRKEEEALGVIKKNGNATFLEHE
jgi:hypothetical protein